jgi:hypothetical protein
MRKNIRLERASVLKAQGSKTLRSFASHWPRSRVSPTKCYLLQFTNNLEYVSCIQIVNICLNVNIYFVELTHRIIRCSMLMFKHTKVIYLIDSTKITYACDLRMFLKHQALSYNNKSLKFYNPRSK